MFSAASATPRHHATGQLGNAICAPPEAARSPQRPQIRQVAQSRPERGALLGPAHRLRLPGPSFKISPTEAELLQLANRLRRCRSKQQQELHQPQEHQTQQRGQGTGSAGAAAGGARRDVRDHERQRGRVHRALLRITPAPADSLPGALPVSLPGGLGLLGRWSGLLLVAAGRWLWWTYMGWLCTRWLSLSVYGMNLRALSARHPPAGMLVVANHISQLDPAVMTIALRALGVDEVLVLGEKDVVATLTSSLMGNVLPVLPADLGDLGAPGSEPCHSSSASAAAAFSSGASAVVGGSWGLEQRVAREVREALLVAGAHSPGASSPRPRQSGSAASLGTGRALVLFPERGVGGREGSLRPWRLSVAALAAGLGCPVVAAYVSARPPVRAATGSVRQPPARQHCTTASSGACTTRGWLAGAAPQPAPCCGRGGGGSAWSRSMAGLGLVERGGCGRIHGDSPAGGLRQGGSSPGGGAAEEAVGGGGRGAVAAVALGDPEVINGT